MNILENSRVYRFLASIWLTLYHSWDHSFLGKTARKLSESYDVSLSARLWNGFCSAPNPGPTSAWASLWTKIRSFWEYMGEILSHSLFYKIMIWFRDLYLKLTETSIVFRWINKLSLHQWVLVTFALTYRWNTSSATFWASGSWPPSGKKPSWPAPLS